MGNSVASSEREAEAYDVNKNETTKNKDGTCINKDFVVDSKNPDGPCVCANAGYVPNFMAGAKPTDEPKCVKPCASSIKGSDIGGNYIYTVQDGKCVHVKDPKNKNDRYVEEVVERPGIFPYPQCERGYWFDLAPIKEGGNRCIPDKICRGASTDKNKAKQCCQQEQLIRNVGKMKPSYTCPPEYRAPTWSEYYHWQ